MDTNHISTLFLIKKTPQPKSPRDFRPISLMNTSMKLLTKVLAGRLSPLLDKLVSESQSAFIKGRQITDSILIASEVHHLLSARRVKGAILKLDFEKAFDTVRWDFLLEVLEAMNFGSRWINWIQNIIGTARIAVLVNGAPSEEFSPGRGLRQGDPLSPLLFILISEVLSKLLSRATERGIFKGISCPGGSMISHLKFADDTLLFIDSDPNSMRGLKRVLSCFELISGLKINYDKSNIYGFHEDQRMICDWSAILGCKVGTGQFKYLGTTIGLSPRRLNFWTPLINKIHNQLQSWNSSDLSVAGKLTLLKASLDSIPTYWLALFEIPKTTLNLIEKIRRDFLWGSEAGGKRKIHPIAWEKVCHPRSVGGLGVKSVKAKNQALLAKWWWRCYSERNRSWNRFLTSVYGVTIRYDLKKLLPAKKCSTIVKSFLNIHKNQDTEPLINQRAFKWLANNGDLTFFWEDNWHHTGRLSDQFPSLYDSCKWRECSISSFKILWDSYPNKTFILGPTWDTTTRLVKESFSRILESFSPNVKSDALIWLHSGNKFITKLCSTLIESKSGLQLQKLKIWRIIWEIKCPPKVLVFLWKIQWGIVPTNLMLSVRIRTHSPLCKWCNMAPESINHLFWACPLANSVWNFISHWWCLDKSFTKRCVFSLESILLLKQEPKASKVWRLVVAATLWTIWLARNDVIFNKTRTSVKVLRHLLLARINKWGLASGSVPFGNDPLWLSNPEGMIRVYWHKKLKDFWKFKLQKGVLTIAVKGIWDLNSRNFKQGAMGIIIKKGCGCILHTMAAPIHTNNSTHAEMEAIIYILRLFEKGWWNEHRGMIYSDSLEAAKSVRNGLHSYLPLLGPVENISRALDFFSIHYVPADLNNEAQELAHRGLGAMDNLCFWASPCPHSISGGIQDNQVHFRAKPA